MATHSSVLAWRIPGTGEPGGLLSMGSHRVGHDWSNLAAAAAAAAKEELTHWKRPWCWERLRAGGKGVNRGWDDWMASLRSSFFVFSVYCPCNPSVSWGLSYLRMLFWGEGPSWPNLDRVVPSLDCNRKWNEQLGVVLTLRIVLLTKVQSLIHK